LNKLDFPEINRQSLEILQVNIGYKCNQSCEHCHVNAGPNRKEMMDDYTISLIPKVIESYNIKTLDITGGAPEMHPKFKDLVISTNNLNVEVIDRCNLTILTEPGYEYLAEFLSTNKITLIASLPCYIKDNVDKQRGKGVFERSIKGLQILNSYGYGRKNTGLILNLVFNPIGPTLPPNQTKLEKDYRKHLQENFGIEFSNLLALANMPINRFANYLKAIGKFDEYQILLKANHNSKNLNSVMCKTSLSVDWKGNLFDCDFNQQLRLEQREGPKNIKELLLNNVSFNGNKISVGSHCFGCTAGSGSSCGGALTN
tara:strand:- start:4651 stop:5592 length:942 start_codon:yes stop_codon:yes gene_type:complete